MVAGAPSSNAVLVTVADSGVATLGDAIRAVYLHALIPEHFTGTWYAGLLKCGSQAQGGRSAGWRLTDWEVEVGCLSERHLLLLEPGAHVPIESLQFVSRSTNVDKKLRKVVERRVCTIREDVSNYKGEALNGSRNR